MVHLEAFYSYFDNYSEVVFAAICPPIVMSVLAYLLIRSVREGCSSTNCPGNNTTPTTIVRRTVLQQMDSQLTLMLILQSIITIITYVPYAAELIYANVTENWPKSPLRNAQEKFFVELTHLVSYVFFASSFYISMILNSGFRRQIRIFFCRKKEPNPTAITQT
jgi:hypothetical protein